MEFPPEPFYFPRRKEASEYAVLYTHTVSRQYLGHSAETFFVPYVIGDQMPLPLHAYPSSLTNPRSRKQAWLARPLFFEQPDFQFNRPFVG